MMYKHLWLGVMYIISNVETMEGEHRERRKYNTCHESAIVIFYCALICLTGLTFLILKIAVGLGYVYSGEMHSNPLNVTVLI